MNESTIEYATPATREPRLEIRISPKQSAIVVAMLTLALAIVTGTRVFGASLWGDEFRTWRDGIEKPLSLVVTWHHNPDHAPLGHLLARAGGAIFGVQHAWALRLGSWLCGLACVPMLWRLGRSIDRDEAGQPRELAGLLVALFFVVDPNIGFQMTQARMYAPLMLAAILATLAAVRLIHGERSTALLAVAIGVGIWSHGQIYALLFALLIVGSVLVAQRDWRPRGSLLLIGLLIGCAIGAQGIWKIVHRHDAEAVVADDITGSAASQLGTAIQGLTGDDWITFVIGGATVGGAVLLWLRRGEWPVVLLGLLTIAFAILNLFVASKYRPIAHPRYLTIVQPAIWSLMAVLLAAIARSPWRLPLGIPAAVLVIWISVIAERRQLDQMDADASARPLAKSCAFIREHQSPGDRFAIVPRSPFGMYTRYYGLTLDGDLDDALVRGPPAVTRRRLRDAKVEIGTIWLICIRPTGKQNRPPTDEPDTVAGWIATSRDLPTNDLALLSEPKGWRAAVVRIDRAGAKVVASFNRDD